MAATLPAPPRSARSPVCLSTGTGASGDTATTRPSTKRSRSTSPTTRTFACASRSMTLASMAVWTGFLNSPKALAVSPEPLGSRRFRPPLCRAPCGFERRGAARGPAALAEAAISVLLRRGQAPPLRQWRQRRRQPAYRDRVHCPLRDRPPRPAGDRADHRHLGPDRREQRLGFARVFARQVEALGRPGDLLLGVTTSGNSPNIVAALRGRTGGGLVTAALPAGTAAVAAEVSPTIA